MATNSIQLDLIAHDLISPVLGQLQSRFGVFGTFTASAISAAFSPDPVTAFTKVAVAGLEAVFQLVDNIRGAMKEAASFETDSLNSAVGISSVAKIPLAQAQLLTREMEKQAAIAAKALPGENKDYVKTGQTIGDALVKAYDLNTQEGLAAYKKAWGELTQGIGFVAATAKASGAEAVNRGFEGFLAGTKTINELRLYDDIAVSPLFKNLTAILEAKGLDPKKVKELSVKERTDMLLEAKKKALSAETIAAYADTVEGMQAAIKGYFFDLQVGIFGVMREVASQGGRSAFDAFKDLIRISMRVGSVVNRLAAQAGLAIDPMEILIKAIDWVSDTLLSFERVLKGAGGFSNGDFSGIIKGFFYGISDGIHNMMSGVDWLQVGRTLSLVLAKALGAFGRYIASPESWLKLARAMIDGLMAVSGLFVGLAVGLVEGAVREAYLSWKSWFDRLKGFLGDPGGMVKGAFDGFASLIVGMGQKISDAISKIIDWLSKIPGLGFLKDNTPTTPAATPSVTPRGNALAPSTSSRSTPIGSIKAPKLPDIIQKVTRQPTREPQIKAPKLDVMIPVLQPQPLQLPTLALPQIEPMSALPLPASEPTRPLSTPDAIANNTSNSANSTFNISVDASGTQSTPESIAEAVMSAIAGRYNTYKQGALA